MGIATEKGVTWDVLFAAILIVALRQN